VVFRVSIGFDVEGGNTVDSSLILPVVTDLLTFSLSLLDEGLNAVTTVVLISVMMRN